MEIIIILWLVFAAVGAWISSQKGRSAAEGVILSLLLGPIGLVIAAVLPGQGSRR